MDRLIFSDKYRRFIIPANFYWKIVVHRGGIGMGIEENSSASLWHSFVKTLKKL